MATRGKRRYQCHSCGDQSFYHWIYLNRAGGLKCLACGSRNLELVSDEAKKDAARLQSERVLGTGGSLKLASQLEDSSHSKVV